MDKSNQGEATGREPRNQALRLLFEYKGNEITLISQERVSMLPPPPHPLTPRQDERGFWLVLSDGDGRPLYRRVMDNPIREDLEVITDDDDQPLARLRVKTRSGRFFVVVPYIGAARSIALFGESTRTRAKAQATSELRRFDLHSQPKREGNNG